MFICVSYVVIYPVFHVLMRNCCNLKSFTFAAVGNLSNLFDRRRLRAQSSPGFSAPAAGRADAGSPPSLALQPGPSRRCLLSEVAARLWPIHLRPLTAYRASHVLLLLREERDEAGCCPAAECCRSARPRTRRGSRRGGGGGGVSSRRRDITSPACVCSCTCYTPSIKILQREDI